MRPYATATLCDWSTCSLQNEPQMNEIFFEMNQILTGFIHYATHQRSRVAKIKEIDAIIKMKKRGEGTKRKSATFMRPGPVSRVKETLCSAAGESRSRAYLTGRRLPAHRPPVLRVAVFFFFFFSLSLSAQDGGDLLSISGHHGRKGSSSPVLLQPPSLFHFFFLPLRVSFERQQN